MRKKGAIEFSITTIIIVIVGVIILALAIPWLTRTIGKTSELTDAAFDNALKQLQGDPTLDEPLVLSQESFILNPGEKAPLIVRFLTDGTSRPLSFTGNAGGWFSSDGSTSLPVIGQTYDWRVVVQIPQGTDPGDYFARAVVGEASVPIVVTVE